MTDNLLLKIARCTELTAAKSDNAHACFGLVGGQCTTNFHIPEPWNGHINKAKILYISSNPSIDPNERYPTESWTDEEITEFFENRFTITTRNKWSRYWKAINKWTAWIFNEDQTKNLLDEYALLTEIVHCKSPTDSTLTPYCQKTCFNNHLREILKLFNGKYVVVVGRIARDFIQNHLDEEYLHCKKIAFIPAPNARGITDVNRRESLLKQLM